MRPVDWPRGVKVVAVCVGVPLLLWFLFDLLKTLALVLAGVGAFVAWRHLRSPSKPR